MAVKRFGLLASLALGTASACTPATPDDVAAGQGSSTGGGGAGASVPPSSGGASGSNGSGTGGTGPTGAGTGGAGPATGSGGGNPAGSTGSGGSPGASGGAGTGNDGQGGATTADAAPPTNSGGATGAAGSGAAGSAGAGSTEAGAPVLGCDWTNPAGRIVLFDGSNLDAWANQFTGGPAQWRIIAGQNVVEVVPLEPPTNIITKQKFEDLCVHVEYLTPTYPSSVTGQDRGNSGVYLKKAYEMQILDSIGQPPDINTCGAVYSIRAPMVVACNKELVWNTYEIEFKSSVWDSAGRKTKDAVFVSATLNGQVVQTNVDLNPAGGFTQAGEPDLPGPQSLMLQDHRNRVQFRNVWVKVPRYQ